MKFSWKVELPQLLVIAAMFIVAAFLWSGAPDRIPVHWNISGEVDRYGGKVSGLLGLPLAALGLYALLLVLPRLDPGKANYPGFAGAYTAIRVSVLGLLVFVDVMTISAVQNRPMNVARVTPLALGVLAIVLGAVMGKLRPNWFVGVRTPWTLSSKVAWIRTHRAAGWVFMLTGIATIGAGLASGRAAVWVLLIGLVGGAAGLMVYSYTLWRDDPDKLPPAGTWPAP
jgi:uncharacterized membrane protein